MVFSKFTVLFVILFSVSFTLQSQSIYGEWKTIDDETGETKSIVNIYEKEGRVYGKIIHLLKKEDKGKLCTKCKGANKDQPIKGMVIIKNLVETDGEFKDGTILDPKKGKTYDCKLWLDEENPNKLNVRGYIGFLFRTQEWFRK